MLILLLNIIAQCEGMSHIGGSILQSRSQKERKQDKEFDNIFVYEPDDKYEKAILKMNPEMEEPQTDNIYNNDPVDIAMKEDVKYLQQYFLKYSVSEKPQYLDNYNRNMPTRTTLKRRPNHRQLYNYPSYKFIHRDMRQIVKKTALKPKKHFRTAYNKDSYEAIEANYKDFNTHTDATREINTKVKDIVIIKNETVIDNQICPANSFCANITIDKYVTYLPEKLNNHTPTTVYSKERNIEKHIIKNLELSVQDSSVKNNETVKSDNLNSGNIGDNSTRFGENLVQIKDPAKIAENYIGNPVQTTMSASFVKVNDIPVPTSENLALVQLSNKPVQITVRPQRGTESPVETGAYPRVVQNLTKTSENSELISEDPIQTAISENFVPISANPVTKSENRGLIDKVFVHIQISKNPIEITENSEIHGYPGLVGENSALLSQSSAKTSGNSEIIGKHITQTPVSENPIHISENPVPKSANIAKIEKQSVQKDETLERLNENPVDIGVSPTEVNGNEKLAKTNGNSEIINDNPIKTPISESPVQISNNPNPTSEKLALIDVKSEQIAKTPKELNENPTNISGNNEELSKITAHTGEDSEIISKNLTQTPTREILILISKDEIKEELRKIPVHTGKTTELISENYTQTHISGNPVRISINPDSVIENLEQRLNENPVKIGDYRIQVGENNDSYPSKPDENSEVISKNPLQTPISENPVRVSEKPAPESENLEEINKKSVQIGVTPEVNNENPVENSYFPTQDGGNRDELDKSPSRIGESSEIISENPIQIPKSSENSEAIGENLDPVNENPLEFDYNPTQFAESYMRMRKSPTITSDNSSGLVQTPVSKSPVLISDNTASKVHVQIEENIANISRNVQINETSTATNQNIYTRESLEPESASLTQTSKNISNISEIISKISEIVTELISVADQPKKNPDSTEHVKTNENSEISRIKTKNSTVVNGTLIDEPFNVSVTTKTSTTKKKRRRRTRTTLKTLRRPMVFMSS